MINTRFFFASLTRISKLWETSFTVSPLPPHLWETGDYVVGEILNSTETSLKIELRSGRMIQVMDGDLVVGAFGKRYATLEATGDWEAIEPDGIMEALTPAGLFGKETSRSPLIPPLLQLRYQGHVIVRDKKLRMQDCILPVSSKRSFSLPLILIVGTSMSAGKTTSSRIIVRQLTFMGYRVLGAKLTGAGRYRDILQMHDAGADAILDFVDGGLPSTVVPESTYEEVLNYLLQRMMATEVDVGVVEIGASPLEPYNGAIAIRALAPHVRFMVLCASDPYAVVGIREAYGPCQPDLIAGIATNTLAGAELTEKLSGIPALSLIEKRHLPKLRELLSQALETV